MKCDVFLLAVPLVAFWSVPSARAEADKDPPSFAKDVKPFLEKYCVNCHQGDKPKGGVGVDTYEGLTKNPKKKVVVAGKPTMSLLYLTMTATGGGKKMPPKKEKTQPTAAEIAKIKDWITAGTKTIHPPARTANKPARFVVFTLGISSLGIISRGQTVAWMTWQQAQPGPRRLFRWPGCFFTNGPKYPFRTRGTRAVGYLWKMDGAHGS